MIAFRLYDEVPRRASDRLRLSRVLEKGVAVFFRSERRSPMSPRFRAETVVGLCLAVALGTSACVPEILKRRPVSRRTEEAVPQAVFAGTGLKVSARLLETRSEIEKRFKKCLPDSGVVPVQVRLRNESDRTMRIHAANGLPLSDPFNGMTLTIGDECFMPLSPVDVLIALIGERKTMRYRRPGLFGMATGMVAVQPFAIFLAHGELSVGKYYRAIVGNSLYPVKKSGVLEPFTLEPGGEVEGFLYFLIPEGDNPYLDRGSRGKGEGAVSWELFVRPAEAAYRMPDSLGMYDAREARVEMEADGAVGKIGAGTPIFALRPETGGHGGELLIGRLEDAMESRDEPFVDIAGFVSQSARVADATMLGEYAACAVNFKSRSRVHLVRIGDAPALAGTADFGRNIEGIHLSRRGLFAMTTDGVCRFVSLESLERIESERFGQGIDGLYFDGARLAVMKEKEISIYGTAGQDLLRLVDRMSVPEAKRRAVGRSGNGLFLVHGAKGAGGDTLVAVDPSGFSEMSRVAFPGCVTYAAIHDGILLQLEEGTLLDLCFSPADSSFRIERGGYLPFQAAAVSRLDGAFIAFGREGQIVQGDFTPREIAAFAVKVPLNPPAAP
jgi:hypothetical protein